MAGLDVAEETMPRPSALCEHVVVTPGETNAPRICAGDTQTRKERNTLA